MNRAIIFLWVLGLLQVSGVRAGLLEPERRLEELTESESTVDVREILGQRESDNPLSELWDANHLKVTKQNVNLNMNMPLNRLKLKIDRSYQVKIVVENDEDFDRLYDYFYPKEAEQPTKEEEPVSRRLWGIKKTVK